MKRTLVMPLMITQSALAFVVQNSDQPITIAVDSGSNVLLSTSRRVDQPTLRYSLEKSGSLTSDWLMVSTYKGDGSAINVQDAGFSVSYAMDALPYEALDFAGSLETAPSSFYRLSSWWISTPIDEYTDDVDETYVRLRSRDGSKYLYQDPATGVVSYETGVDLLDFRSHWFIQTSMQSNRFWILNRMSGDAMKVAQAGPINTNESLLIGDLAPSSTYYQWIVHEEPGFFWIESAAESGLYVSAGAASSGTAVYAELDAASEDQKFIVEPLPQGALMPWVSYDEDNYAAIGNGALVLAPTYDRLQIHSEAQKRSAVLLDQEQAFVKWTLEEDANAFVLRYAIEDAPTGGGLNGTVTMILRDGGGAVVQSNTIPVTSEQAWVYFDINMIESNDPAHGRPAKRFNEARVKLPSTTSPGYSLELRRVAGEPLIWIDVVETELIDGPITVNVPAEYLDVTSYGAVPDDGSDDRTAFVNCINAARSAGKGVYIPAGRFLLDNRIDLSGDVIQGAGMWHTELLYTYVNGGVNKMGFWGQGSDTIIRDLYMTTLSTRRDGGGNAIRKHFGTGSRIENVWAEHFDAGGWITDYFAPYRITDGLVFFNCRIRNTFADGAQYTRGTRNSIIENCHFRSTGDDSMATWSSDTNLVGHCVNNKFRYNTVELNWRAAGIGVFGGESHKVHHNIVRDVVSGSAMRFVTSFSNGAQGYEFSSNGMMRIYRNSLYRSGTDGGHNAVPTMEGAINLATAYGDVQNIAFSDIYIDDVLNRGVFVDDQPWGTGGVITNITFNGMVMTNMVVGTYVDGDAVGSMTYTDVEVSLDPVRGIAVEQDNSPTFEIINTP